MTRHADPQRPREPALADLRDPVMCLALGFGSGLAPRAPGTAGSVVGSAVFLLLAPLGGAVQALSCTALVIVGVPICGVAARRLGQHDHGAIVWDELACVPIALAAVPLSLPWLIGSWIAFRAFDVLKPWPIGWLDRRLGGGLGIMVDDLAAALLAAAVVGGAHWLWLAL